MEKKTTEDKTQTKPLSQITIEAMGHREVQKAKSGRAAGLLRQIQFRRIELCFL